MTLAPAAMALVMSPEYLMPPSAMMGMSCLLRGFVRFADGGDLRHARAGDHARGADGAGTDADLDGVRARIDEGLGSFAGGDVAGEQIDLGKALLDFADGVEHARGVAVGGIDGEDVDAVAD